MAENQFQGHQKKKTKFRKNSANRAMSLCRRKGGIFFLFFQQHFGFPFAEGNQPAAPES